MPRLPALAEMAWTPDSGRHVDAFEERLKPYLAQYQKTGVHYFDAANPQKSRQNARSADDSQVSSGTMRMSGDQLLKMSGTTTR